MKRSASVSIPGMDEHTCLICSHPDGRPNDVVVDLTAAWVTAGAEAPLPGYACVVAKRHVVEPYELAGRERAAFWEDCLIVAEGLADLLHPVKMNYEIHGNTIPHLHMHMYPRYVGDHTRAGLSATKRDSLERLRILIE
jgi:diadenosine tetraphosphate (Ap4A) HIT family hydrolase